MYVISEINAEEIEGWKKDEKKYAITTTSIKILNIVKKKSFVVLTGSPGIGKSATARHIALLLRESDEYDILPISEPNEIIRYAKKECKQIYIIDDFCGKYLLDQNSVDLWTRLGERVRQRLTFTGIKILATSRLQVWNTKSIGKFSKALNVYECNILSKEFALKTSEKRLIAKSHLGEETVKLLTDEIIREADMFPLLCMLFSKSKNSNFLEFFTNPTKIYQEELEEMQMKDHGAFVGLALLVIFNNSIQKDFFDLKNTKDNNMLDQVIEECKLPAKPTKLHILERLQSFEGTYITEKDNEIEAIHNKIFDIIALFFGNFAINSILQHSRGRFICERIHFKSLDKVNDPFSIVIAPEFEISYFKRIGEEVEKLRFFNVFAVNQLKCEAFQLKFISFITNNENLSEIFAANKWPLYLSVCYGYKALTVFIIDKQKMNQMSIVNTEDIYNVKFEDFDDTDDDDVKFHIEYIRNPDACLMMACCFGYHEIAQLLVNGYDVNAVDDAYQTPLYLAACNNSVSIVLMLLRKGAWLSYCEKVVKSPLYAASEKGYIETVKLLLKEGAYPDEPNHENESPLLIACENDNLLIVEELIRFDAKINVQRQGGNMETALHIAIKNINLNMIRCLLDKDCDVNICDKQQQTPLHMAIKGNRNDIISLLLEEDCDVNIRNMDGNTPLYIASSKGKNEIVNKLLNSSNFCDVNIENEKRNTALYVASEKGLIDIVNLLFTDKNVDVNLSNVNQRTPLFTASNKGHTSVVEFLLDRGADANQSDNFGGTPFYLACRNNSLDIAKLLLDKQNESTINCQNQAGNSPLIIASLKKHVEIVKLLLENNCDINLRNNKQFSALDMACTRGNRKIISLFLNKKNIQTSSIQKAINEAVAHGNSEIVNMLLTYCTNVSSWDSKQQSPLYTAILKQRYDMIPLLLDTGIDIDFHSESNSETALHLATKQDNIKVVRQLLEKKCNVNSLNDSNESALLIATCNGFKDIVKLLLENGGDINLADNTGHSPFFMACLYKQMSTIEIFLSNASTDINKQTDTGETPLISAVHYGDIDIVKLLLENKCDVDKHGCDGPSALHIAVIQNKTDMVLWLLENNGDVNVCDCDHQSPLHLATYLGYKHIVNLLIKYKCDVNLCDYEHRTALHIATWENRADIVKILIDSSIDQYIFDNKQQSAFHIAALLGYGNIVQVFLNHNYDVNHRDGNNYTALHLACWKGHEKIVSALLKTKRINHQCSELCITEAETACANGFQTIFKLLSDDTNTDYRIMKCTKF